MPRSPDPTRRDESRTYTKLAFLALALFFFVSSNGIVSTADGSSYQLTRALVETGQVSVDPRLHLTIWPPAITFENANDVAVYQGRRYSDRPPGTGLAAVPFYLLGKLAMLVEGPGAQPAVLEVATTLLSCVAAALAVLLAGRAALALGTSQTSAAWMALALAAGSLLWKYSGVLYTHALSACLMTALVALAFKFGRQKAGGGRQAEGSPLPPQAGKPVPPTPPAEGLEGAILLESPAGRALLRCELTARTAFGGGALIAAATLVEYQNLLLALPLVAYLWRRGRLGRRSIGAGLLGGLCVGWLLPAYNAVAFGSPFSLSYAHQTNSPWDTGFAGGFSLPSPLALWGLVFGGVSPMGGGATVSGLLQNSPILLLLGWGLWWMARRGGQAAEALVIVAMAVLALLVAASFRSWWGDLDARYVLAVVPALFVPLALWLDGPARGSRLLRLIFAAVLAVSVAGIGILGITGSGSMVWGFYTHFGPAGGMPLSFYLADHGPRALDALLPNLANVGLLAALALPLAAWWFVPGSRLVRLAAVGLAALLALGGLRLFAYIPPTYARPAMVPLDGFQPSNPLYARLGDAVELMGYRLQTPVPRGEQARLTLYWVALRPPTGDYTLFVRAYDQRNQLLLSVDAPAGAPAFPSRAWPPGVALAQAVALPVPAVAAPGSYRVDVGLYTPGDAKRLEARDPAGNRLPGDAVTTGALEVRG